MLANWLVLTMDQEGSADSFLRDVSSENTEGKAVEEHSEKQYPGCRRNRICRSMWLWLSFFSMVRESLSLKNFFIIIRTRLIIISL